MFETIQIAVEEVQIEESPVVLPLPEEVVPAKVITIKAILPENHKKEEYTEADPEELVISAKVTIAILVTEEEVSSLSNTILVLVLADGSMVEIPYEVIDDQLVFTTTQLGVFAFIPAE